MNISNTKHENIWLTTFSDAENAHLEQSVANTSAHFRTGHESDGQVQSNESTKETQLEQADGK